MCVFDQQEQECAVPIAVGTEAPDFEVLTSTGENFRLSDLRGQVRAMLVFYPKDFTPGCTDQLVEVRNNAEHIREIDTEPIGVNPGDAATHERFRAEYELPFDLLVDEDSKIAEAYDSLKPDGSGILRSVIVVGKSGNVIFSQAGAPAWQLVYNAIRDSGDE
jgi:peroxiredoxin Q/BCP